MIVINLLGPPVPWKRPAHRVMNGKVIVFDAQHKEKEQARWQMRTSYKGEPLTCPVAITMTFFFVPPKSCSKVRRREYLMGISNHISKPDVDNLAKFYMDCLTGVVLGDDCQVFSLSLHKTYDVSEGVRISIAPERALKGESTGAAAELFDDLGDC
jgi:Holliday junction resolvase RusA-like endonuclease